MSLNIKKLRFLKDGKYQFPSIAKLISYLRERSETDSVISNLEYSEEDLGKIGEVVSVNLSKKYLEGLTEEFLKKSMPVFFLSEIDQEILEFFIKSDRLCPLCVFVSKENLKTSSNLEQKYNGFKGTLRESVAREEADYFLYIGGSLTNINDFKGINKKVCAIVSAYEDEDIIEEVCNYLLGQDVHVHVIDNWSKDGTYAILKKLSSENSRITYERFPRKPSGEYLWAQILRRKEEYAQQSNFDWYIHYDSDEIRESSWRNYNLREAISFVDSLGYTAIDHTVLDFRPVNDDFVKGRSLLESFSFFEFGNRLGHFAQVKAWKNLGPVDLVSSGGHMADFEGRKIFPFKFLLRHYSLRNREQMKKKIFKDRLPRIHKEKKKLGWHIQYDSFAKEREKIKLWKKKDLLRYETTFYEKYLLERLTGINIPR
jgi:hypothetical protein